MDKQIAQLNKIGNNFVRCSLQCEGVVNKPSSGIIPRGLIYEKRDPNKPCVVVVGINPGKSEKEQRKFYLKNKNSYQSVVDLWAKKNNSWQYYKKSRALFDDLGLSGDIIWTDLAKCECSGKNGEVPTQTLRICIDRFLQKEIETISKKFIIIALGNTSFNFCALRFPKYFVIGLPHPSAYGHWKKLKDNIKKDKAKHIKEINTQKDKHDYPRAVKLIDIYK